MPFALIFCGVIGGALAFGLVGVFLGPTLLAVAFRLIEEWSSSRYPERDESTEGEISELRGGVDRRDPRMAVSPSALGKVVEVFERNFRDRGELGASISIWWDGAELLSAGTVGASGINPGHGRRKRWCRCIRRPRCRRRRRCCWLWQSRGLNEEAPVREVWPRFPVAEARFFHLLSHQCGLAGAGQAGERVRPPRGGGRHRGSRAGMGLGDGHGYHPRTFGSLMDEPVRRLTGSPSADIGGK
jgi:hypothetical protein